jgi:hypothetical protein
MAMKTAHDFDQELLALFDAYVHGALDRRGFLDKAAKFAVGGVTAVMLLDQLSPKFLEAQVVKPEDPRIKVGHVEFDSPKGYGKMRGYLAQPAKATGKLPAVLVIHENRGLNPHIEDIARPGEDARGLRRGNGLAQGALRNQRQDRRGRLLLRRRHGQFPGDARARARRRRRVLRQLPERRGRAEDQGGAHHPVRRNGRAHQRELAGV